MKSFVPFSPISTSSEKVEINNKEHINKDLDELITILISIGTNLGRETDKNTLYQFRDQLAYNISTAIYCVKKIKEELNG